MMALTAADVSHEEFRRQYKQLRD